MHIHRLNPWQTIGLPPAYAKKWFGRVTLDLDSSVRTVFGNQEGAKVGCNPHKKGKKSYHPIFCFIAETRECLHSWFRDGSAYSANGAVEFVKETQLQFLSNKFFSLVFHGEKRYRASMLSADMCTHNKEPSYRLADGFAGRFITNVLQYDFETKWSA